MAAFKIMASLAILLLSAGTASARQLLLFGWGDGDQQQQNTFGVPITNYLCAKPDYQTMCALLQAGANQAAVSQFADPALVCTMFTPDDNAWNSNGKKLLKHLGLSSLQDLVAQPDALARVLTAHVIVGQALQYDQLKNDDKYLNAGGQTLEIDTGIFGGKYVKGPQNTVGISGTDTKHNMQAARSMMHKVDDVIIPK